jgi:hypothetical protein
MEIFLTSLAGFLREMTTSSVGQEEIWRVGGVERKLDMDHGRFKVGCSVAQIR